MARVSLLLLALVATVACVSAVSTGSPILRLSSTGGVAPVDASSAAPVVVASSTGGVAPAQYLVSGSTQVSEQYPLPVVGMMIDLFLPQLGRSVCAVFPAAGPGAVGRVNYTVAVGLNMTTVGTLDYSVTVYSAPLCSGPAAATPFVGSALWPSVDAQWNNFTVSQRFVDGMDGKPLLPSQGEIDVQIGFNLQYFGPNAPEDEEGPDVHPVLAVLLCAGVILLALIFGSSLMKSWQSTKFAPAGTIAGDAIAAGSYGKF
jgi:hypothetical protein